VGRGDDHHDRAHDEHAEHLEPVDQRGIVEPELDGTECTGHHRSRSGDPAKGFAPVPEHGRQLLVVLGEHLRLLGHLIPVPPDHRSPVSATTLHSRR